MVLAERLPEIASARTRDTPPVPTDIYSLASDYVSRHWSHKARIMTYDAVVDGRWSTVWPDGTATQDMPKIGEYITSDTEGIAALAAGPEASIVVPQDSDRPRDLEAALRRQQILYTYRRVNKLRRLRRKTAVDLVSTGLACWVVWPNYATGYPAIVRKDPRVVYPDPAMDDPAELSSLVVRYVTKARLVAAQFPQLIASLFTEYELRRESVRESNENIEIIEYYDQDWCIKIAHRGARDARYKGRTLTLVQVPNITSCPLALIAYREAADGQFRGQFDKAIPPLGTANKLMELHLAQQADMIFAEKIIRGSWDNPEDVGPGANLYTMDYQANIERAETAQSSQQLYQDVQLLLDQSRTAAAIPQGWHGAVDQNIISAQGINALNAPLATAVSAYQEYIGDLEQRTYQLALELDEKYLPGVDKQLAGIAGGRSFTGTYTPADDIAGRYECRVSYPAGSNVDAYNRSTQAIQNVQYGLMSRRKGMELSDMVEDVAAMEAEIFKERAVDGFIAGISDPAVDLITRAQVVALLSEGNTPDEVIIAMRDQMLAAQQAQQAAAVAEQQLLPAAGPPAAAPTEEAATGTPLPPIPGRNY